jgi:signal transduction histidine kinase
MKKQIYMRSHNAFGYACRLIDPIKYIVALLLFEMVTLILITQVDGRVPPITPLSVTAAVISLLVGVWPLLLRPSLATQLNAALGIVLAGFVLIPIRPSLVMQPPAGMLLHLLPAYLLYRLGHGILLVTVGFHVAVHFPTAIATPHCPRPTARAIVFHYLVSALLTLAFVTTPVMTVRPLTFAALLLWVFWLASRSIRRLLCLSRTPPAAQPQVAQQARLLLTSVLLAALPTFLLNIGEVIMDAPLARADLVALFLVIFPTGAAYTILRHDLLTLDSALRRTLAYTVLSALALLLYFAVTLLLTVGVVRRWPSLTNIVVVLSVLTTAFAFAPLQQRVQGLVDRWLYPERRRFSQALAAARTKLASVVERQAVLALLTKQLPSQIDAHWATLTLTPAPATPGQQATAPAWSGVLVVGDRVLGRYWLGPRRTLPTYDLDEQEALQQLLYAAALVLAYTETIDALQQLNQELEVRIATRTEQVVAQQRALAAYAERQQLARNLHDSITQSLFSLTLGLRAIRKQAQHDPQAALTQVGQQEQVAQGALTEMRELLGQLRSSEPVVNATETVDLVMRLQQLCAEQQQQSNLTVTLIAPPHYDCPSPLALEIVAIAREALHNVVKHSGVQGALCTLAVDTEAVRLTVADQGQGFDLTNSLGKSWDTATIPVTDAATAGHFGLRGMQERSTAIGGTLTIESALGAGTVVMLHVPRGKMES